MMGREDYYDDDVDTMTEETEDVALNPDYDRVSGSGEMPSLDDFLGVNHSSDGLGASSDPFGNVIGDPAFSGYHLGGTYPEDGFDTENADTMTDGENNEQEAEQTAVKGPFWRWMIDGNFFRSTIFSKNIPFLALLAVLGILHIANRNSAESLIREEMRLTRDVNELRGESILIAAKLMEVSKVTEVSKLVETRKLGIHAVKEPPMQFVMDKFYRADSLIKIDPKFERTYDDLDYELQN
jgi:hypothetical protein